MFSSFFAESSIFPFQKDLNEISVVYPILIYAKQKMEEMIVSMNDFIVEDRLLEKNLHVISC